MTKKTTKKYNPLYIVDFTNVTNEFDVKKAVATAKFEAGLGLSSVERDVLIDSVVDTVLDTIEEDSIALEVGDVVTIEDADTIRIKPYVEKKPNIFKRFWNWLTRK